MRGFRGWGYPSTDFGAARDDFKTQLLYVDVDLSAARSIAAGSGLRLPIAANFLCVDQKANSGTATAVFQDDGAGRPTPVTLVPGAVFRATFTQLIIENIAQPGQVMRLLYGVDVDLNPGQAFGLPITVINGQVQTVKAGQAFAGSNSRAASVGNFSHVQLWNPPGSGLRAIVTSFFVFTTPANRVLVNVHNVAAANAGFNPANKLAGGPVSTLECRTEANAAQLGANLTGIFCDALQSILVPFDEPVILPPGWGVAAVGFVVNQLVHGAFSYYVEASDA